MSLMDFLHINLVEVGPGRWVRVYVVLGVPYPNRGKRGGGYVLISRVSLMLSNGFPAYRLVREEREVTKYWMFLIPEGRGVIYL